MPPIASPPPDTQPGRLRLFRSAVWSHRWGVLAWSLAGGGFLTYFGAAYGTTVGSFAGGAKAFGLMAAPTAQAMRFFSGPASRLDTYGGYVTYHNATMAAGLLALWALIQGARAIRGWEERGVLQMWLATGMSRSRVLIERWLGFISALGVIGLVTGVGFGLGTTLAGEPNWPGSLSVAFEMSLVAAGFFGVGLLASQLTRTARGGAGVAATIMFGLYFSNNMYPNLGGLGFIRFASPFFYFQQSPALVPGRQVDIVATLLLLAFALVLIPAAVAAFKARDLGAAFMQSSREGVRPHPAPGKLRTWWNRDIWIFDLRLSWVSLSIWSACAALLMAMLVGIAGQITNLWESSELISRMLGTSPGATLVDRYLSYTSILAAVVPVAYAVTEAARWVSDIHDGRAAVYVAANGSRRRVVLEWAAALAVGVIVINGAVIAGAVVGASVFGIPLRGDGLARLMGMATLMGMAIGGLGLMAVVLFRSELAVGALATVLGLAFILSVFGPLFNWPDQLIKLSPFNAFGAPYLGVPEVSGMAILVALALVGGGLATTVADRRAEAS